MNKYQNKKVKTLILENNRGITPKYIEHGGITVLNQKCIRDNKILFEYSRKHDINKNNINPKKFLKKFDVLINSTGVGTLGRVAQLKRVEEPITYDSHISLLRPDPTKINLEYFGYAIGFKQNEIDHGYSHLYCVTWLGTVCEFLDLSRGFDRLVGAL